MIQGQLSAMNGLGNASRKRTLAKTASHPWRIVQYVRSEVERRSRKPAPDSQIPQASRHRMEMLRRKLRAADAL